MAEKVNTKILDDEAKKEAITGEETSRYSSFNNKYLKAGIVAALSYYASKKNPYFLKGFADKIEEFEKADRETRNRYVEASAKSITDLIAKNKLKRQARIERITEPIQKAVNAGLSITNAAKAHKLGIIPSLLKIKLDNTSADLNKFFTVSTEYTGKIPNFSQSEIIEALAGKAKKLDMDFSKLKAPKRISPISGFLGVDEKDDVSSEISSLVSAEVPTQKADTADLSFLEELKLTPKGQRAIASKQKIRNITPDAIRRGLVKPLALAMGIDTKVTAGGDFVFSTDDTINEGYATDIQNIMSQEIENKIKEDFLSPTDARTQVYKKYFTRDATSGALKLKMSVVGPNGLDILPSGWTPSTPTGKSQTKTKTKTSTITPDDVIKEWDEEKKKLKVKYGTGKKYKQQFDVKIKSFQSKMSLAGGNPNLIK